MQEVFKWLFQNWRIVLEIVLLIASVIFLIIKKKPVSSVVEYIMLACLDAVLYVEHLPNIKGQEKLNAAVDFVYEQMKRTFPDLDITRYKVTIVSCIELILKTPQKKGEK